MRHIAFISAALTVFGVAASHAADIDQATVRNCQQTGIPAPGIGHPFKGAVHNDDYNFSVTVPTGLTGWSGVAEFAPFHGFTIYFDATRQSCIAFDIHLRVDEEDAIQRPAGAKSVAFGEAKGWQIRSSGAVNGVSLLNVTSNFSFKQADQVEDGSVQLIASSANAEEALKIYDKLLGSLIFGESTTAR